MEDNYVVIKVKYGDMLRRFNASIVDDELDISIVGLRKKTISLFNFPLDSELMLTYIDEDGDIVTLADDDDLRDVVNQALNPLRITVNLIEGKNNKQKKCSRSSTPLASSQTRHPQQNLSSYVLEYLSNAPEPVRETLVKLSADLISKASSTSPIVTEIVDLFSRMCSTYVGQLSLTQPEKPSTTEACVSESSKPSTMTKELVDSDLIAGMKALLKIASERQHTISMEKFKPEENVETNEAKFDNMSRGRSDGLPAKAFNYTAVAAALNSRDFDDSSQGSILTHPRSNPVSDVGKKGKAKKEKARKITKSYLCRRQHHLSPNPLPGSNKHWRVDKSYETSLLSCHLSAGLHRMSIGKEINSMPNAPNLGPIVDSGSVSDPPNLRYLISHVNSTFPADFVKSPNLFQAPNTVGLNIAEFSPCPVAKNDSSVSGSSAQKVSVIPPHSHPSPQSLPLVRSTGHHNGTFDVIHPGVRCDGCGLYPITGPRFKSNLMLDYDLCDVCFQEIGNKTDYVRLDGPVVHPYQMSFKGLNDVVPGCDPTLTKVMNSKVKQAEFKLDSRFVQDVNVSDGTTMPPLLPFVKIWRMRNNGTVVWPQKTQLVWVGGDKLSSILSVDINVPSTGLMIDQELDVAVDLITPKLPGRYISYWRLASPSGQKFGQRVWVLIQVNTSMENMPREVDGRFNLNLPPISSYQTTNPDSTKINREMMIEKGIKFKPSISKKPEERVEPEPVPQQNSEHDLKFPINDSLLVGNGSSNFRLSSTSSVSHPIINLSDMTPPPYAAPPDIRYVQPQIPIGATRSDAPESAVEFPVGHLLRQLKEMGFNSNGL